MSELRKAVTKGDLATVRRVLSAEPQRATEASFLPASIPKAQRVLQTTPLHKAVGEFKLYATHDRRKDAHVSIAALLLDLGADWRVRGSMMHVHALASAALAGHRAGVDLLLARGATVDPYTAAALGDLDGIDLDDPDRADTNGMTQLMYCAASRLDAPVAEVARRLLEAGADPSRSWDGIHGSRESHLLPTSFAAMGNRPVLDVLLLAGAATVNPTSPGANGTATAHATWSRCAPCLSLLLARFAGFDPDDPTTEGYTPLHWIARTNPTDGVALAQFVAYKRFVKPGATDATGKTASQIARSQGDSALADALEALGA